MHCFYFFFRDGNKSSFAAAASAGRQTRPGSAHATDHRMATREAVVNGAGKPVEVGGGYVCRVFRGTRARHKFYSSLGRGRHRKTLCRARHHTRSNAFNPTLPYLVDSGGEMVVTGIGVLVRVWFGVCKKRSVVKGDVFGLCPFLLVHFFVHFIFLFIANRPVSWKLAGHGPRDRVPGECLSGRTKATRGGGGTRDRGETLVGARPGRICVGGVRHACLTISGLSPFFFTHVFYQNSCTAPTRQSETLCCPDPRHEPDGDRTLAFPAVGRTQPEQDPGEVGVPEAAITCFRARIARGANLLTGHLAHPLLPPPVRTPRFRRDLSSARTRWQPEAQSRALMR